MITERKNCRGCGQELPISSIISLGDLAIVDFVKPGEESRGRAPLDLVLCDTCQLVQLRHSVDQDTLYRTFWYRSGINEQMRLALKEVVDQSIRRVQLEPGDWVCDIGSNDGTLLGFFDESLCRVGFEPSRKLGVESTEKFKIQVVHDYFNARDALRLSSDKRYKVVTAIAMFYDLENPVEFLKDVNEIMADDGLFVIQMNYLPVMMRNLTYDNISHEHLCYYSLASLLPLLELARLKLVDAEINDVNGGSIRIYISKQAVGMSREVYSMITAEIGFLKPSSYTTFADRIREQVAQLRWFLYNLKRLGKKIYAYGASTRGSILLQMTMEGQTSLGVLLGVADRDPNKWGREMAGLYLPIIPESIARQHADYFLLLPYHFWQSISKREWNWMKSGGRFIIPIPYPRVVGLEDVGAEHPILSAVDLQKELETLSV